MTTFDDLNKLRYIDDKLKKELAQLIEEQFSKNFITMFNQGFEELILPEIERIRAEMATRTDLKREIRRIEVLIGSLQESTEERLDNHEKRVKKLETPRIAS